MSLIWTCPDHDADLEPYDGIGLWCPQGEHYIDPRSFDDPDDARDALIDFKEMSSDF